ncbi:hypothetical protein BT67DRAFT_197162 [Trichocladium antarcticum]|uniref:Uncharacterized protein n=1 Tax=Trichocladium antarcticum TaxID=1450529 RepID=A0AAN6UPT9_9PEZI|nr:hypothetical protein BT67DRAFT_197162 [Trichocladium antarcticum]
MGGHPLMPGSRSTGEVEANAEDNISPRSLIHRTGSLDESMSPPDEEPRAGIKGERILPGCLYSRSTREVDVNAEDNEPPRSLTRRGSRGESMFPEPLQTRTMRACTPDACSRSAREVHVNAEDDQPRRPLDLEKDNPGASSTTSAGLHALTFWWLGGHCFFRAPRGKLPGIHCRLCAYIHYHLGGGLGLSLPLPSINLE